MPGPYPTYNDYLTADAARMQRYKPDPRTNMWGGRPQREGDINLPAEDPSVNASALQGLEMPQLPAAPRPNVNALSLPQPPSRLEMAQEPKPQGNGIGWTGGKSLGTAEALSGLKSAQDSQSGLDLGPMELNRLAHRDPNSVQPGSNDIWAGMLKEQESDHQFQEGLQQKALEGISGAIAQTHPAVQFNAEAEARRKAMPAAITGRAQLEAAREAGNSRRDVGEAGLEGRVQNARYGHLDAVMNAIRAIRGKTNVTSEDTNQLRALMALYDQMSQDMTGATFEEATQNEAQ